MSTYSTEFEHKDSDGDEMWVNRCCNRTHPLMLLVDGGHGGIELFREDVEALAAYLTSVADTVPSRPVPTPTPAVTYESAGVIRNGQLVWHITPPTQ